MALVGHLNSRRRFRFVQVTHHENYGEHPDSSQSVHFLIREATPWLLKVSEQQKEKACEGKVRSSALVWHLCPRLFLELMWRAASSPVWRRAVRLVAFNLSLRFAPQVTYFCVLPHAPALWPLDFKW